MIVPETICKHSSLVLDNCTRNCANDIFISCWQLSAKTLKNIFFNHHWQSCAKILKSTYHESLTNVHETKQMTLLWVVDNHAQKYWRDSFQISLIIPCETVQMTLPLAIDECLQKPLREIFMSCWQLSVKTLQRFFSIVIDNNVQKSWKAFTANHWQFHVKLCKWCLHQLLMIANENIDEHFSNAIDNCSWNCANDVPINHWRLH